MPTIKNSRKNFQKSKAQVEAEEKLNVKVTKAAQRRPGREVPSAEQDEIPVVDVESGEISAAEQAAISESSQEESRSAESTAENPSQDFQDAEEPLRDKVDIAFFGSELIRSRFPQPFDLAEKVATNWVYGGEFKDLPIEHPLGNYVVQKGLLKAKEIEKKVLESPVTEKVAMQVLTTGMKAQSFIEQLRQKLKK